MAERDPTRRSVAAIRSASVVSGSCSPLRSANSLAATPPCPSSQDLADVEEEEAPRRAAPRLSSPLSRRKSPPRHRRSPHHWPSLRTSRWTTHWPSLQTSRTFCAIVPAGASSVLQFSNDPEESPDFAFGYRNDHLLRPTRSPLRRGSISAASGATWTRKTTRPKPPAE